MYVCVLNTQMDILYTNSCKYNLHYDEENDDVDDDQQDDDE